MDMTGHYRINQEIHRLKQLVRNGQWNLARERNAAILYDEKSQAPYFNYWRDGKEHVVWFEDARSIKAKFDLLKELELRGISYWHIGFPIPAKLGRS